MSEGDGYTFEDHTKAVALYKIIAMEAIAADAGEQ